MGNQMLIRLFSNLAMSPHILDRIHSQDVIKICKHNPGHGECLPANERPALSRSDQSGFRSGIWYLLLDMCRAPAVTLTQNLSGQSYVTMLSFPANQRAGPGVPDQSEARTRHRDPVRRAGNRKLNFSESGETFKTLIKHKYLLLMSQTRTDPRFF